MILQPSNNRIVGGAYINITFVPYMLSLMLRGQHICGGGILNENFAITAAHCAEVVARRINDSTVRSGSSYRDKGGVIHNVVKVINHKKFDSNTNNYDIAILKIHPPFKYDSSTQPLKIPFNKSTPSDLGFVAGWGYFLNFDPVLSEQLQYVLLPKVSKNKCKEDYSGSFEITETQVCYGLNEGGHDACRGDSGGPMVNLDNVLIAVTSWGDGCAHPNQPGVYTDAILLRDWIKNNIGKH
ncbi:trypsin-4-like [Polistes fuscatus]|uniref:trypsin-4-like n=1 Tax=Polistes fuscatus TaxID=30207 RepID=UPI001CA9DC25|nr:trypsin-4-like [Polistes fuscatus]XP_043503364.1 trypsin-4-like [Polistes fuscatus]